MRLVVSLLLVFATPAAAERYVVQPGETLEHVADAFGCSTADLLRANKLNNTLVPARTIVTIPSCPKRVRTATRSPASAQKDPADAKARAALATIDGTPVEKPLAPPPPREPAVGPQLPKSEGYHLRRPDNAFGAPHVITYVRGAIAEVRALYPDVHVLAIGDLSSQHGGKLDRHLSHQSGVDIDIGFYFRQQPASYPAQFVEGRSNPELDLEATWALLVALSRSADRDDGVTMMFLDYDLQARLVRYATKNGTPKADLEHLFQYPRGKDTMVGLVRHWPSHADHVHVRFAKKP